MVQQNENNEPEELEEGDLGQQVDRLLEQGYSQKEIRNQGFSPSLVRQRVRKRTKRLVKQPPENNNDGKPEVALTRKEKEEVLPEYLASQIETLYDGSVTERKAFLAGISVPLLGMRMFAESFKPMLALMQTYQAGQAEAAKAAQGGSEDIAQQTIVQAMPYFKDMITEVSRNQAVNPLQGMMVRMIEPMISNLVSGMFKTPGQQPQAQSSLPPGWISSEEKK